MLVSPLLILSPISLSPISFNISAKLPPLGTSITALVLPEFGSIAPKGRARTADLDKEKR
jgi:hypothetical protein